MANKNLNAVITIGGTVTGALKSALGSTRQKLQQIGSAVRDLEKEQRKLGSSMRDAMNSGAPIGHLHQKYAALTGQIAKARREQERMTAAARGMDKGKAMMGGAAMAIGTAAAVASAAVLPVVQAASFEKAMLGVAKQVEGARGEGGKLTAVYYDMAKAIQAMGREIPVATNDLAKMVEAGARMGVGKDMDPAAARQALLEFTRVTAEMGTALELPTGELADSMGKIKNLYKMPIGAMRDMGDAINYLDDNAISKGGDIIDFLTRTGGVAGAVKVTGKEMAALGSTLLSLGERSEMASTATNAFFQKLAAADKGTKKFRGALKEIGISAKDVQKGMQIDAQGTVLKVIDAVNKLPKEKRLGALVDLVGLEHSDTIAKLAGNVEEYRKQIGLVNSQKASGSMGREFAAQLASTTAQWEILKNRVVEVGVNIGSVLLPAVNATMGAIGSVGSSVADWARENPRLVKSLVAVGGALLGTLVAFKSVTFAVGAVKFAWAALKIAMMSNPIGLIIAAVAVGAALIIANWDVIGPWFAKLWEGVKSTFDATWTWIKDAFLTWHPLGIVIKNWGPIKDWFGGMWADIKATAGAAIDWVLGKIAAVGDLWGKTKALFSFGGDDAPVRPAGAPAPRTPPPAPPLASARGQNASPRGGDTNTYHITQQPGESGEALAKRVARLSAAKRTAGAGSALYDKPRGY